MNPCLDTLLFSKKGREDALSAIVQVLTNRMKHDFVDENFATLLYGFSNAIKKGSAKEVALALRAIGLMAMQVDCNEKAKELYEEVTYLFSTSAHKPTVKKLEMANVLVIVTFAANNSELTEKTMQILWSFIHREDSSNASDDIDSIPTLVAMISAWCFLLSTLDGWRVNGKQWKRAIPYFCSLLEVDHKALLAAVCKALCVIMEVGSLEKFSDTVSTRTNKDSTNGDNAGASINSMKDEIIAKITRGGAPDTSLDFIKYFKDGKFRKTCLQFRKWITVELLTWSSFVQLEFLRQFLGESGFLVHIGENELLHDVFDVIIHSQERPSDSQLYKPETEEVVVQYMVPKLKARAKLRSEETDDMLVFESKKEKEIRKRLNKSANSPKNKARTQLMNKKRTLSQESKTSHFVYQD